MLIEKQYDIKIHGFAIEQQLEPRVKKARIENEQVNVVREAAKQAGALKRSTRLRTKPK